MGPWVTVVLPGSAYPALGAAIRLPVLALEAAGAETAEIGYPNDPDDDRSSEAFHRGVAEQVRDATAGARRVTFVAKSLGTMALATLDKSDVGVALVDAIWLTPLFGEPVVRAGAIDHGWRSLLVAGGADRYHDASSHEAVRNALGARSLLLEGADHALEVPGDPLATVDRLRQLTEAAVEFRWTPA